MNASSHDDITRMLNACGEEGGAASEELLPLIYDELRRMAAVQMAGEAAGQTLQPTALVHEAWLKLHGRKSRTWNDREHFFRATVRTMRRILVDRSRRKSALKHGGENHRVDLEDIDLIATTTDDRVLLVDAALTELEKRDADSARIVDLKFFGGFTNKEIAWMTGVSERTVERQWVYAKACMFEILRHSR